MKGISLLVYLDEEETFSSDIEEVKRLGGLTLDKVDIED
jgi:hypothetical protein